MLRYPLLKLTNPYLAKKGELMLTEKSYAVLKTIYLLGGRASAKKVFNAMTAEDRERLNITDPISLMHYIRCKKYHISKSDELGEKYQDIFGGRYRTIYQLKPRVMRYFENELKNAGQE